MRTFTVYAKVCLTLSALVALSPAATAKQSAPTRDQGMVALADRPYIIPSLGVSISLPDGSFAQTYTLAGDQASAVIVPQKAGQRWQIVIKSHKSTDNSLTNSQALDELVKQIMLSKPAHNPADGDLTAEQIINQDFKYSRITVESRQENLDINGIPAERVYLTAPNLPEYPDAGITIYNPEPGQFLLVHIECPHGTIDEHKPLYEVVSTTVAFRDQAEVNAERGAAILATNELFNSLNSADLEAHLDEEPRFFRLYNPGPSGRPIDDEDVAWQRATLRLGQSGELAPGKPKTRWSAADREFGFLLQIDARALWQGTTVDSQGIFFLSRDRQTERWSIRNTIRGQGEPRTTTQTLVRQGDNLSYVVERPGEPRYTGDFRIPDRGYLSKVEAALLPRFIASRELPGQFGYYIFDSGLDTIVLRNESYEPDGTGRWTSIVRPFENAPPQTSVFDDSGRLIQRTSHDGQIMEPIDPDRLRRIWSVKNLQTGQ